MASECPSYRLEQQYPHRQKHSTIWSEYGVYRSFERARAKAALLDRPCRITECRVVWRSVALR
ncbi:hypothetical protein [Sphingopyxis sp. 550A]